MGMGCASLGKGGSVMRIASESTSLYKEVRGLISGVKRIESKCRAIVDICKKNSDRQCTALRSCAISHGKVIQLMQAVESFVIRIHDLLRLGDTERAAEVLSEARKLVKMIREEISLTLSMGADESAKIEDSRKWTWTNYSD